MSLVVVIISYFFYQLLVFTSEQRKLQVREIKFLPQSHTGGKLIGSSDFLSRINSFLLQIWNHTYADTRLQRSSPQIPHGKHGENAYPYAVRARQAREESSSTVPGTQEALGTCQFLFPPHLSMLSQTRQTASHFSSTFEHILFSSTAQTQISATKGCYPPAPQSRGGQHSFHSGSGRDEAKKGKKSARTMRGHHFFSLPRKGSGSQGLMLIGQLMNYQSHRRGDRTLFQDLEWQEVSLKS